MQRPLITSVLVVGIAAAGALTAGRGPSLPGSGLPASMLADETTSTSAAAKNSGAPSQPPAATDDSLWLKQLADDPRGAGRADAQQEEGEKICGFIGVPAAACAASANAPSPAAGTTYEAPQVMIAIAPDPIHTHLALLFDRAIDAFEDGLQDSGWQYQGYWLPWSSQGGGKTDTGDLPTYEQQRLFFEGREESPGVLFFRSEAGEKRLVVFVVTDSPTAGINPSQFRAAIRDLTALAPTQNKLSILGPSFTGALPSLHLLVGEAKSATLKDWAVRIASGSVRDYRCGKWTGEDNSCIDEATTPDSFVSFGSAFYLETQETVAFLIENGGLKPEEIALLTEDESSFGDLPKMDKRSRKMLRLTFPRGISHLRNAYQKNGVWGFGGASNASSVNLTLDFDEPHEADDTVPSFSKQQLPVSQEGSMGQISATLEQRNIKAVLLSATDVMDELFVAQMLARQAPNVTVVVRGTDVLFLRSGDGGVYHNMYAVSPWPLIPKNHWWSRAKEDPGRIRSFPSGDSEGYYNATRYLLDDRQLQDYTSPIRKTDRPPLWFSAIGHGAYWPMAVLTTDPSITNVPNLPPVSPTGEPQGLGGEAVSLALRFAIFIASGLSLLHAGKCMDLGLLQTLAGPRYSLADGSSRSLKLWLQLGVSLLGLLMLCLLAVPGKNLTVVDPWSAVPLIMGAAALSLAAAHSGWKLLFEKHLLMEERKPYDWQTIVSAILFFAFASLVWMAAWRWSLFSPTRLSGPAPPFDGRQEFLFFRANYPLSGSSPILPLLLSLGGLALALVSALGRLNFGANLAPRLPEKVDGIRNCPTAESMLGVTDLLVWPADLLTRPLDLKLLRKHLLMPLLVVVTSLIFGATMHLRPQTFEGTYLTTALTIVMFVVLIVMVGDLVTSVILWRRLKLHCLDPLESSPLRRGFSAISGITWKDLWLIPQSQFNQYRALSRALEQSTRKVMDSDAGALDDQRESLRSTADSMWKVIDEGKQGAELVLASFGKLQDKLAKTAAIILLELSDYWKKEVDRVTAPDSHADKETIEKESDDDKQSDEGRLGEIREEWVALIYVHYVRLVLVQIRSRLTTAAMLYLVLAWSVTSYPYINRHALLIGLTVLLAALACVAIWTYASINRDPILSRTTEHVPGKLDFDFYAKTASMVGIPLIGLVASQFPEITSFLFSWIEPGMSAVK